MEKKSGLHWVAWANLHALNSVDEFSLAPDFRIKFQAFKIALEEVCVRVNIVAARRSLKRAYLFHWCWKIALGKCDPCDPPKMAGIDIQWDDHIDDDSIKAAKDMVKGFKLAVPPRSKVAPSLTTNHASGRAVDLEIIWKGKVKVKKKDGTEVEITYMENPLFNKNLIAVGASYGLIKHMSDAPHWSTNGR